jgi:hypothetical protein
MRYFINILKGPPIPLILSFTALLFALSGAQAQTKDSLQVLKEETVRSVRKNRPDTIITTYDSFEINSCTLSFTSKTIAREESNRKYWKKIYRYSFP